jgi:hypothetical protein
LTKSELARLKKLVAELTLDKQILQDVLSPARHPTRLHPGRTPGRERLHRFVQWAASR